MTRAQIVRNFGSSVWMLAALAVPAAAQRGADPSPGLTVVNAAPEGEVASREEANEIRVVFSESMVVLGRIPPRVTAPFFRVTPAIPGTFRWSGTTTLIFTPDSTQPLPFATRYDVTIDTTAAAVSGRRLAVPYRFSFTTPTVRLLKTHWYRRGDLAAGAMVILLRFNQPVRPAAVAPHLTAQFQPHAWTPPPYGAGAARVHAVDATALDRFNAKVALTRAAASSSAPVQMRLTSDWDQKRFPASPDLVAFEVVTAVPPQSWVRLTVDGRVPSISGSATRGIPDAFTVEAEPALFVDGFLCSERCVPEFGNHLTFRTRVRADAFAAAVAAADVTDAAAPSPVRKAGKPRELQYEWDDASRLTLEDAGFAAQPPARTYEITVSPSLRSRDGQTLGYTWVGRVENWHHGPFTSFGDGHGVWEKDGGAQLPFYARNFRNVTQWAERIEPAQLVPLIMRLQVEPSERDEPGPAFAEAPATAGVERRLGVIPDRIQSHGLDLSNAISPQGAGLVWAAVRNGSAIERASYETEGRIRASIVQATNLGITVKDSPQNTLIFVTRLDTGAPVAGARVTLLQRNNMAVWSGTSSADGIALAPRTPLRDADNWWKFAFVATAEKDGDIAYTASDWNEGIQPWNFGANFDLSQAEPMLRGTVFSDRGVYRLGEDVHLKAVLRHNTPSGVRMLTEGTRLFVTMQDSRGRMVDERIVTVNAWSSAEWKQTVPADGALGSYSVRAVLERHRPVPRKPEDLRPEETPGPEADRFVHHNQSVAGGFLVAAYRRPDFRVDVTLAAGPALAGEPVKGAIAAKYLFGASMGVRPANWRWTSSPIHDAPPAVREAFPSERWLFVGWNPQRDGETGELAASPAKLTAAGELVVDLQTRLDAGLPYIYTLEGDVEDVSRQRIANRASVTIHPAPWYVGLKRPGYFVEQKDGVVTEVVTVSPAGQSVAGVTVELKLTQVQWTSVRRAEGNGFYTWDTERKEVPAGSWSVTTGTAPVPFTVPVPNGGYFLLDATARDGAGRFAVTRTSFYALGEGYTAWARYDHNRIELVPEKKTYRPGETARIMIQSPWEQATALVTMEREGIKWHRPFALTSTQQSVSVPITEGDIPNVFVSVLLIKGRSPAPAATADDTAPTGGPYAIADPSDPGKPSFRLGYVELEVEDRTKRLTVAVRANKEEYRPANEARVQVVVNDHANRGAQSEVTLWAVDYGVLSLTDYRTPDVLRSVYVAKALQVMTTDSRQRIISRRVLTPKGETDGGGGGVEAGGGLRKDFRVLAFWLGSVVTDRNGRASVDVKLPESLTTYRIMAVAGDRASRFGNGDTEVRVNKPLTLKPAYPRFLAVGDRAKFGAVVTSQLSAAENATITIRSLDPSVLAITGPAEQRADIPAGGAIEVRFEAAGKSIGRARVQMTVRAGTESDAFEDFIPVEILASAETVAAYGVAGESPATETVSVPAGVVPGFGGLHVELASTALAGLGEGARYLVEYPYGCAEQRGSRTLALVLGADLGEAFSLPGIDHARIRPAAQASLKELERYQCGNGGFAYWPTCHSTSPYLTSYLLHVFKTAQDLKYKVTPDVMRLGYDYLETTLGEAPPENEGWWPAYTAWQAFAVKVLVEGGRKQDSNLTRIHGYRDRMPVFALANLHDALAARGELSGDRAADLRRRISNAILTEAGGAHVEELSDPYLLWFWNSNVRSTAMTLGALVRAGADEAQIRPLVRWLLAARQNGRWQNTQENAWALQSLVHYYRKYETIAPDFRAVVRLGAEELVRGEFKGRSSQSIVKKVPMAEVLAKRPEAPLTFERAGAGTLFYTARLQYAADQLFHEGLDNGIRIARTYEPFSESGARPAAHAYAAGDLVRVTLTFQLTKERRYVAVTDPLPAGFEPVESWFATTARNLAPKPDEQEAQKGWRSWWQRGGFDHIERHDDRVRLFATRLSEGRHEFNYVVRATTAGTFRTAPARAEEMYQPEVFGRTETAVITVR